MDISLRNLIAFLAIYMLTVAGADAKSAILVAHYGSSDDSTRAKTISLITRDIARAFEGMKVREAYISPIVRKNLARRGIPAESSTEALIGLCAAGYDTVYVQSTTLIDGTEMGEVRKSVEAVRPFFRHIATGNPLLYSPEDCREVMETLADEPCGEDEAVVYVGHGNGLPSTATYSQLDMMFAAAGHTRHHVSTIEGYPTAISTATILKQQGGIRRVRLIPLLLVCGNHSRNDIAGDFSREMRESGFGAEVVMRGLGESEAIRRIYVERLGKLIGK